MLLLPLLPPPPLLEEEKEDEDEVEEDVEAEESNAEGPRSRVASFCLYSAIFASVFSSFFFACAKYALFFDISYTTRFTCSLSALPMPALSAVKTKRCLWSEPSPPPPPASSMGFFRFIL